MSAVPYDVLREIGAYWAGHRLLYTCRALYTSWNPDSYLVTESKELVNKLSIFGNVVISTMITRMPSGAHHGQSVAENYYTWNGVKCAEIIEYCRGDLVSVKYHRAGSFAMTAIIGDYAISWVSVDTLHDPANMQDVLGAMWMENGVYLRGDVPFRDFIALAAEIVAHLPAAERPNVEIMLDWDKSLPGTQCVFFTGTVESRSVEQNVSSTSRYPARDRQVLGRPPHALHVQGAV